MSNSSMALAHSRMEHRVRAALSWTTEDERPPQAALRRGPARLSHRRRRDGPTDPCVRLVGDALGPAVAWPQSLKTSCGRSLDSRYAMWLGWGPEFTFFYNDAYAR